MRQKKKIQFQMGIGGLIAIFFSSLCVLLWVFVLGFWAGQKFIQRDGKDISQLSVEPSITQMAKVEKEKETAVPREMPGLPKEEMEPRVITPEVLSMDNEKKGREGSGIKEEKIETSSPQVNMGQDEKKKKEVKETSPSQKSSVKPSKKKEEKVAQPSTKPAKDDGKEYFSLQIAAFKDRGQASQEKSRWQEKGYEARFLKADLGEKGIWYRVYIGKFETPEEARSFQKIITKKEDIQAYIVSVSDKK